jgi:hypothetical protein
MNEGEFLDQGITDILSFSHFPERFHQQFIKESVHQVILILTAAIEALTGQMC